MKSDESESELEIVSFVSNGKWGCTLPSKNGKRGRQKQRIKFSGILKVYVIGHNIDMMPTKWTKIYVIFNN